MSRNEDARWKSAKEVITPALRELCETILIQADLQEAARCLTLWSRMPTPNHQASDAASIYGSLFRDSVVQFVACFEKTAYPLNVREVYAGVNGAEEYFTWLKGLRNSYAAHRYGAARQCKIGVMVAPDQVIGVQTAVIRYAGPDKASAPTLLEFVQRASDFATAKAQRLMALYKRELEQKPIDEILGAPPARLIALLPGEMVSTSRGDLARDHKHRG